MMPIIFSVFLIVHGNRRILVDAGCETMPGFEMRNFHCPTRWIDPELVSDIIITHAHHDHIEAVKYFKSATVYIQKEEYIKGKKYIPDGFKVCLFDEGYLLGKDIRIVKIGGHSIGSCVVEVFKDGKIYVLCGDECYSYENLREKIPTGTTVCAEKSKAFIEKYSSGQYCCLLCHDIGDL
ncbi:MAG: MBL fold metallo-hydrolase [Clostridia bacterium]|nr:MBL fold metallo-hydrolase [Clostridia bacterium]